MCKDLCRSDLLGCKVLHLYCDFQADILVRKKERKKERKKMKERKNERKKERKERKKMKERKK